MERLEIMSGIADIETIAIESSIDEVARLWKQYGQGRWRKLKGVALIRLRSGRVRKVKTARGRHQSLLKGPRGQMRYGSIDEPGGSCLETGILDGCASRRADVSASEPATGPVSVCRRRINCVCRGAKACPPEAEAEAEGEECPALGPAKNSRSMPQAFRNRRTPQTVRARSRPHIACRAR